MFFDTHAHVNFKAYETDAEEVIRRSLASGVNVINVGSQIDTSRQAVELAGQFDARVYAVVGLHPEHTHSQYVDEEETHFKTREEVFNVEVYGLLAQNPKVVGIGECGLDYYRLPAEPNHESGSMNYEEIKQRQKDAFIAQIKLAKELNKTLVIHSRSTKSTDDAGLDIFEILKSLNVNSESGARFVLHGYTGSPEVLKKFFDLGGYVSYNGILTFDKTGNMEALLKSTPLERFVLETDCPYLTPVPHRGKRNEPLYVKHVAEKVSQLLRLPLEEVEKFTEANTRKLFNI